MRGSKRLWLRLEVLAEGKAGVGREEGFTSLSKVSAGEEALYTVSSWVLNRTWPP
jgi:hypothetical protein